MNTNNVDSGLRHISAVSRRGSLRVLAGTALAGALAAPAAAKAGNGGKNASKRCKKQRGQCLAAVAAYCAPFPDPETCTNVYSPCCEYFVNCNVGNGIECIFHAD